MSNAAGKMDANSMIGWRLKPNWFARRPRQQVHRKHLPRPVDATAATSRDSRVQAVSGSAVAHSGFPAEISEFSDFQWVEHQLIARVLV